MRAQYANLLTARYKALAKQEGMLDHYLYRSIFPKIGVALMRGCYFITFNAELVEGAKERLIDLGYAIYETDVFDEKAKDFVPQTTIQWDKPTVKI